MNGFQLRTVPLLVVVLSVSALPAQVTDSQRTKLIDDLLVSVEQLDASRIPDLEASKREVVDRVKYLRAYLDRSSSVDNRDAWLEYLQLDPLVGAIESGDAKKTTREARDLQSRLIGIHPGLEVQPMVALRNAINQLIPAIRYRDRDAAIKLLARQLNGLAKRYEKLPAVPTVNDAAATNLILGFLADANQDVPAMKSMRKLFGSPNARVWVGEPFVQNMIGEQVDEHQPVTDCILGTRITGQAHFVGLAKADLLPATDSIRLQLTVSGQVASDNVGYNRGVRICSQGFAGICVSRAVNVSDNGITFEPTYTDINLKTKINGIGHRSRLVRRIAWRKAGESKAQADAIAKRRMHQRLKEQFDQDTRQRAAAAPDAFAQLRAMLLRLEFPEPPRHMSSSDDSLVLQSTFRRDDQIGAPVLPPPMPTEFGAVIQIHETAIDNALGHLLAGRTVTETQIKKLLADIGRELPEDDSEADEPPFEIDFASIRPVVFEARDNGLRLGVRCTNFRQGNRELPDPIIISSLYKPTQTEDGRMILVRDGNIKIDFPGGRRLTLRQAGMRNVIIKNFSDIMPEQLLEKPLKIPADSKLEAIRGREFITRMMTAANGWLTAAVD